MIRVISILLILLSFANFSPAKQGVEDYIVFNKQDISQEILWPIHTILQDHEGRMWFSGKNYLVSYDGNQIDTISLRNTTGDVFITGTLESCKAHLSVSITKGLYIIDPRSKGAGSSEPVLEGCINVMLAQDEDHLWLGTNQGLLYYSLSNGLIKKLTMENGLPSDVVHGLLTDADSALWISTWNGMAILPAYEALPAVIKHNNSVLYGQMAEDSKGLIWAGGESEIIILDKDQRPVGSLPSEINSKTLPPTYIPWQVLFSDSRGWIWHAVPDNLYVYDPGSGIQCSCNLDFNLRIEQPTVLFEDKDGSIWLATTLGNIYRYDLNLFSYQILSTLPCPFPVASILSVAPLQSDNVAIATSEGLFLSTTEFDNYRLILRDAVTGLCIDSEYRIWVTTNDDLVGLELDERSLQTHEFLRQSLPDISVSGLRVDGSDCWISTFDRGIMSWSDGTWHSITQRT